MGGFFYDDNLTMGPNKSALQRALACLSKFHLKTLVGVALLCLLASWLSYGKFGEEFPFSDFPMYSSFDRRSYYVYVSGGDGEPVPLETITEVRTSKLKKIYQNPLEKIRADTKAKTGDWRGYHTLTVEQRRPAGEQALDWLYKNSKKGAAEVLRGRGPLELHQVWITVADGGFSSRDEVVAKR